MSIQMVELHFPQAPTRDGASIAKRAEELVQSGIELRGHDDPTDALLFFHTRHSVDYADGELPAQTAVLARQRPTDVGTYADEIQQSWACDDARDRLQECTASLLVTEMMARTLEPLARLRLFHGVLQAVTEITKPHAMVFTHSQQVIDPADYLASCNDTPIHRPGSLNVRFVRSSDTPDGDMVMDTRGLAELGLHDLQCHFHSLDPDAVCGVLQNTAVYIAENGAVIESGHTVAGTEPGAQWKCQLEDSILEPSRELLDLNPGAAFAAGNR